MMLGFYMMVDDSSRSDRNSYYRQRRKKYVDDTMTIKVSMFFFSLSFVGF